MRWKTEVQADIQERFAELQAVPRDGAALVLADLRALFEEMKQSPVRGVGNVPR